MPRLGTGMPLSAGLAQEAVITIEDFVWEIVSSGNITPLDTSGTISDTSNIWDYDGTDIMLEADPEDEGFWEEGSNLVLNHDYEDLGSELANFSDNNISFDNSSDSTTISLGSNSYRSEAFGNTNDARPRVNINGSGIVTGKTYEVTYTPTSFTGSTVFDFFQNSTRIINNHDASVAKTFYFVASDGYDGFDFDGSQTFRSDYTLSIKQVDPNGRWTLGTGWTISDGKANFDGGSDEAIQQSSVVTNGDTYEVTFTVSGRTTGSLQLRLGNTGVVDTTINTNGTHTNTFVSDGTSLYFRAVGGFDGSIDNVSVKEYAITPLDV